MEKWLNVCEARCTDTENEKKYVEWWTNIRSADVLDTAGFVRARLFEVQKPLDGRGRFISIYDIETDDIDKTMALRQGKRQQEIEAGRSSNSFILIWVDVLWKQIATRNSGRKSDPSLQKWVRLTETYNVDPAREDEFNDWYTNIHLAGTQRCSAYIYAARYKRKEPYPGRYTYFSVYEVQTNDIDASVTECRKYLQEEVDRGDDPQLWRSPWPPISGRLIAERTK